MTEKIIVNAKGLSCPQPVLETQNAFKKFNEGIIEVHVDTVTSRENVSRFARKKGWSVTLEDYEDWHKIILKK